MTVVAITGASGFLGNAIIRRLSENNIKVKALENLTPVYNDKNITVIKGNLKDKFALKKLCEGANVVIHCAGLVSASRKQHFYDVNVGATQSLIDTLKNNAPSARFLFISSLAAKHPHLSPYADSKKKAEDLIYTDDISTFDIFRPPAIYGPGDKEILPLLKLIKMNIGVTPSGPSAIVSMIYVEDLAKAVLKWVTNEKTSQKIYEISDDKNHGYTWAEIMATLANLMDKPQMKIITPPRFLLKVMGALYGLIGWTTNKAMFTSSGKVNELLHPDWSANNQEIKKYLHWGPKVSFGDGAKSMLDYYKKSGLL